MAPEMKKTFDERKIQIKRQKLEKLIEKQNKREQKEEKNSVMKVELVNEITEYGGVWQSFEKIDVEIEKMRSNGSGSSKILAALYCQIKFHKEILQSKGPKELFQKTVKNKSYTELELI